MTSEPENAATPVTSDTAPNAENRQWAMIAHFSAFVGLLFIPISMAIPFFGMIPFAVIAPLVIWLMKKDTMPFVNDQGKEAVNFNITVFIAGVICSILIFVLIGLLLLPLLLLAWIILVIMAGLAANKGETYRYPVCLRLIK